MLIICFPKKSFPRASPRTSRAAPRDGMTWRGVPSDGDGVTGKEGGVSAALPAGRGSWVPWEEGKKGGVSCGTEHHTPLWPSVGLGVNSTKTQPPGSSKPFLLPTQLGPQQGWRQRWQRGGWKGAVPHGRVHGAALQAPARAGGSTLRYLQRRPPPLQHPTSPLGREPQGALQSRGRASAPQSLTPELAQSTSESPSSRGQRWHGHRHPGPVPQPPGPSSRHPTDLLAGPGGARLPTAAPRGARLAGSVRPRLHWHRWVPRGGSCPPAASGAWHRAPSRPGPFAPQAVPPPARCVCPPPSQQGQAGGGLHCAEPWHSSHPA